MRPVVLVAAIGASAVLGGVVGGALVRTMDRVEVAPSEPVATVPVPPTPKTDPRLEVLWVDHLRESLWWCNGAACMRDRTFCDQASERPCEKARMAYCPNGNTSELGCAISLAKCDELELLAKTKRPCVGVE